MIKLRRDNPYSTGAVYNLGDGVKELYRNKLVYNESSGDKIYTINNSDTLDLLAQRFYGNSKFWWVLADVNNIRDPFTLLPDHRHIIIPDINKILVFNT